MSWKESGPGRRRLVITGLAVLGVATGTVAIKRALAEPIEVRATEDAFTALPDLPEEIPPPEPSPGPPPVIPHVQQLLSSVRFETQVQRLISHCALSRSTEEQPTLLAIEIEPIEGGLRIAEVMLRSSAVGGERELDCAQDTLRGLVIAAPSAVPGAPFHTRLVLGMPAEPDEGIPEDLPAIPQNEEEARRLLEQAR